MAEQPLATGSQAKDLSHALQDLRTGRADAVEIRGDWLNQEAARVLVGDFISVFELDAVITELPDGFRIELREPPDRTLRLVI